MRPRRGIDPLSIARLPADAVLQLCDVYCFRAFRSVLFLVGDLRSLSQRAVAVTGDPREMHEQVPRSIVGRDEAEALVVAEPLDGTRCHVLPFDAATFGHIGAAPEGLLERGKASKEGGFRASRQARGKPPDAGPPSFRQMTT